MAAGDSVRDYMADLGITTGGGTLTETQLNDLMTAYGQAPTQRFFTPEQQMRQFVAAAPGWQQQSLWDMYSPLSTRFGLSRIGTGAAPNTGYTLGGGARGIGDTFAGYLGQYGGGGVPMMGRDEMIARAQQAAAFGRMSPMALGATLGGDRADESMYGYYTYGGGPQAAQNQAALALQLALTPNTTSMTGGPVPQYGGAMQQAITGAMGDIYAARQAAAPEQNFLQWYLDQITGVGTLPSAQPLPTGAITSGTPGIGYTVPTYTPGSSASGTMTAGSDASRYIP